MKIVFVDTVLFVQCRELAQLPWRDLFDDEELLLIVPYAVVSEIDRHKQDWQHSESETGAQSIFFLSTSCLGGRRKTHDQGGRSPC